MCLKAVLLAESFADSPGVLGQDSLARTAVTVTAAGALWLPTAAAGTYLISATQQQAKEQEEQQQQHACSW
uniref:Uncharacterized protein n=1 Tax=Tetradesmus obliquus TaxID=3088 RepID=A0A383VZY6_TETOB|eukprot:jgi/Sobl393_1/18050/SZX71005.1